VITELKAHIKREFVDLAQVSRYFETLKMGNKSSDFKLSSVSFSSTCHLIKRVGMQDPNSLRGPSKIILPMLINRLLDSKPMFKNQAKSALETYWLATPSIVENYIRDNALIHSSPRIRAESIMFISDLIELNKNFNFQSLLLNVVNLMHDDVVDVAKNAEVLLLKYYILHRSKVNELVRELKSQKIDYKKAFRLLRDIDTTTANSFASDLKPASSRPTIDTFNNLSRQHKKSTSNLSSSGPRPKVSDADLSDILGAIPSAKLDDSIRALQVSSASDIHREVEQLLTPFNGKETEFNWNNREKNIIKFRGLVLGNADSYPDELVASTRSMLDGINKSVLSLRTTLSTNGCQLVKELASYLNKHIDPIAENLFTPLAALTSATKKISSMNAFGSICVLLMSTSFNNRLFNHCYNLFLDKNVQPRLYSSTFLRIFIQKHSTRLDNIHLETVIKWVTKGVADPNTIVRESMRTTLWVLCRKFPDTAEAIISKQDANVRKALERSKPSDIEPSNFAFSQSNTNSTSSFERKRPSVREFIAAKKNDRRSISGPPLTTPVPDAPEDTSTNASELGKPLRIGMPQRVRVSSASDNRPLEVQLSKGRPEDKARRLSLLPKENIDELPIPPKDEEEINQDVELMLEKLRSPLTRDRVEGIELLKNHLLAKKHVPSLTTILKNLAILDALLLKPLLAIPDFFDLIDLSLSIKVLAVNKLDICVLIEKFGELDTAKGLVSMVKSLDSLQFDNAPSTMFHIKYKTLLLDYSVQNLYRITSSRNVTFDKDVIKMICSTVFPLSISDYPRYDELIVQLHQLDSESFLEVLASLSTYVRSKVNIILDDFKDDLDEKQIEQTIPMELTMINPFNSKSVQQIASSIADENREMDPDKSEKVDYMSDIFTGNSYIEPIKDFSFVGSGRAVQRTANRDINEMDVDIPQESQQNAARSTQETSRTASPFLEDPEEDDVILCKVEQDEVTHSLTVHMNEVHISPQKVDSAPSESFNAPDRNSLSEIIKKSDPIFSKTKSQIQIFEDSEPLQPMERRLFDLELSRIRNMEDQGTSLLRFLELLDRLNHDNIGHDLMNSLITSLPYAIHKDEIIAWMKDSGFMAILTGVINYFDSSVGITKELCFKGLIVLKELLIINEFLDGVMATSEVKRIWNILLMIVENLNDFKNAIYISVDELTEDLISLSVPDHKGEILKCCCSNLKQSNTLITFSFLLSSLAKCIEYDVVTLKQIKEIDGAIYQLLSHDEVEIRRLTIITYSKCKQKLQQINSNHGNDNIKLDDYDDAEHTYNFVFEKLSQPQRKLVDYYCEN
jgi:CLIP-associating protein 1/2